MNSYQRAATWIDRFASRLQKYDIPREDAVESAFDVWNGQGIGTDPEGAADALYEKRLRLADGTADSLAERSV